MSDSTDNPRTFFGESQRALMHQALNRIVPAGDGFPAAGDLGVVDFLDAVVGRSAELKRLFAAGVAQIEIAAEAEAPGGFAGLSNTQMDEVLRRVESRRPLFFAELVKQTYNGYYSNREVRRLLGPGARPPLPYGHEVETGDLSLLENVKKRGRIYREV